MSGETATRPARVLEVFFQLHNRGGEQVARDIEIGLAERGHDVEVVGFFRRPRNGGIDIIPDAVVLNDGAVSPLSTLTTLVKFAKYVRSVKPHAAIIHTTAAALITTPLLRLLGVRRRIVIHHNPIGTYQGGPWVWIEKLMGSLGFYTDVVFVSEKGLDQVADYPARYRQRASTILNGVSIPAVTPRSRELVRQSFGIEPGQLMALSVGSLEHQKNQRVIVEAAGDAESVHLIIAGDGPLRPELERLAKELDVAVTFTGNIPRAEIVELYHTADVLLFPSLHEGRPLTLIEATLAGIPVVSSDIVENRAVLGDAADYLDPQDSSAWASAMTELALDPEALTSLRARMKDAEVTTVDDMVDGYEALLA
ncbi:MAG: glycosyltransferase family 4 protein [Acidimicrobiia bacterium]|nr:glycosyltransferase family 4 protein [Acidimicrobiia bacterium]